MDGYLLLSDTAAGLVTLFCLLLCACFADLLGQCLHVSVTDSLLSEGPFITVLEFQ